MYYAFDLTHRNKALPGVLYPPNAIGDFMPLTVNALIAVFLEWCASNRRPRTVEAYKMHLDKWAMHAGGIPIAALTRFHLTSWAKTWHQVQAVQRLLQFAVDELEILARNPFAKVKRPPMGQRHLVLAPRILSAFLRAARPAFRRFLLAMRSTMARPQEIRALRWSMLQSERLGEDVGAALVNGRAVFVMRDYKARDRRGDPSTPRILLVNKRLAKLLVRLRKYPFEAESFVFVNSYLKPWTKNAVRCCMRRLRRRCAALLPATSEKVVTYSIRHSMLTWACSLGYRDRLLSELAGHADVRTIARYQHLCIDHLRTAVEGLENVRMKDRKQKK